MKREQSYKILRIALTAFVAIGTAFAVVEHNLVAGATIVIIALFLSKFLREQYRDVIVVDERTWRIHEKAIRGAFVAYAVLIGIASAAIAFIEPLKMEIIEQIKPVIYHISLGFFIMIAFYAILKFYYDRKM